MKQGGIGLHAIYYIALVNWWGSSIGGKHITTGRQISMLSEPQGLYSCLSPVILISILR
jgi:hypothetical protein